jgi:hypothetical protein
LRRCGDLAITGEGIQKRRDLGLAEFGRVALAVKINKAPDPVDRGFFRAPTEMLAPHGITHLLQQVGPGLVCRRRLLDGIFHHGKPSVDYRQTGVSKQRTGTVEDDAELAYDGHQQGAKRQLKMSNNSRWAGGTL